MLHWSKYIDHTPDIKGKRKKIDNTIYTFDIETTSYLILNGKQIPAINYLKLSEKERKEAKPYACMYIWMFSINDVVYYGRTWIEFEMLLSKIENNIPQRKIIFVHNLAFEFQFLKSVFHFSEVTARKSHKVMTAQLRDYNIMFKCSYIMSDCALKSLPKLFKLPVEKLVGDLNYDLMRHYKTELTEQELGYCENDCLVVYHYILYELETYERVDKIPTTSTGHVRRELMNLTLNDLGYKRIVRKSINVDPIVFNRLQSCFGGGYTHANWLFSDTIMKNVDSYDECSAYPYILTTHKFPSKEFKKCDIKTVDEMSKRFAYILTVHFKNLKCKYYNSFISASKCTMIENAKYDNGRIIEAKEIEIVITDIDFYFILDSYECEYEIKEAWFSLYNYLPKKFIEFVLDKYVLKTKYKGVVGKELEYQEEKRRFNALYSEWHECY